MEAVPRLPMVSFQLKVSPESACFASKLKQYIRDFYKEDPESYNNEIHQLENLRASAVRPPIDIKGCELLKRYYCQLYFLQSRFPMGKDSPAAVTFTWKDTYANTVCSLANIRFEMIHIMYNIGAIHTQLGSQIERTSPDGMKIACTHFQCASWAFDQLKSSSQQPLKIDIPSELITFMYQLCLAQGQECILEKSMLDNRKPSIVAKVARQIVDYYNFAFATLEQGGSEDGIISGTVGSKIYKIWKRYVKFKRAYHLAVTQLYQGLAAEEQRKMGERVAFYNASLEALNEARTLYTISKGVAGITGVADEKEAIEEALTFTNDVIEGKRKAAKNENEYIYHEEVPEKDVLPIVKGASLVKGISFNVNDPDVSGSDIFARLVPMKVHEANSMYSEEKAKLLRSVGEKIEERNQQLNIYLMSLKLENLSLWDPDSASSESEVLPLPEELAERCAAMNAKSNAIQEQVDSMSKLCETYHNVEFMLREINVTLSEEQKREKQYQAKMGKRPPSIVATDLTREAKKYEEAHAKASESNQALHKAMNLHLNNLRILSQPLSSLISHIPPHKLKLSDECSSKQNTDHNSKKNYTRELKRILYKVDEMRRQRNELHEKLRDALSQDDLTRLLVTTTDESEPLSCLFAEQINKHQPLVNLIEQNLAAQDIILSALTEAYARTADTRKAVDEALKHRELIISSLNASYDAHEDLLAKTTKGLEFYRKMEINVSKLLQRVKNTCKVQEEERVQILAQNLDKAHALNDVRNPEINDRFFHMLPKERNATDSGLKLEDNSEHKLTNILMYQNQYPDQNIQSNPKIKTDQAAEKVPVTDHNGTNENVNLHITVSQFSDYKQAHQYYRDKYPDHFTSQQSICDSQYMYGETANVSSNSNSSFPRAGTTFSDSVYRQAGKIKAVTELASGSETYSGYTFLPKNSIQYPPDLDSKDQHSTSCYNANNSCSYPVSQVIHGNPAYQAIQNICTGSFQHQNLSPVQMQLHQQIKLEPEIGICAELHQTVPNVVATHQSYNSLTEGKQNAHVPISIENTTQHGQSQISDSQQIQAQKQHAVINFHPLGIFKESILQQHNIATQNYSNQIVTSSERMPETQPAQSNQSVHQHSTQTDMQQQMVLQQQTLPQKQPTLEQEITSHTQFIENAQIASTSIHYSIPQQYTPNQYMGMYTGTSSTDSSTYSSASNNILNSNMSNNFLYAPVSQYSDISSNLPTNYSSDQTQNYVNTEQQLVHVTRGQESYLGQLEKTMSAHNYNTYDSCQQTTDTSILHGYLQNSGANQSMTLTDIDNSEIIQSHAKLNSIPTYQQAYYDPLKHCAITSQYVNYPQAHINTFGNVQQENKILNPLTSSYQGHPGYVHSAVTGGYQYSSGYQDTHYMQAQDQNNVVGNFPCVENLPAAVNVYQQRDGYFLYTNANNDAATNQTASSQYYYQDSNSEPSSQPYHSPPYVQQAHDQGSNLPNAKPTYNQTNTQAVSTETNDLNRETQQCTESNSNIDLLSGLDIAINHAPLLPEVQVNKIEEEKQCTIIRTKAEQDLIQKHLNGQIDEKNDNLKIVWDTWYLDVQPKRDPLGESTVLQKFVVDIEKYEKFIDSLLMKTLSGATTIDIKWNEIKELEAREDNKQSFNTAMIHSGANRSSTCISYDLSGVKLTSVKEPSYINASHVKDITQWTPAAFIVTQAPKTETFQTFWTMVWEQESEVIACLATDLQLGGDIYWPASEDENIIFGDFTLKLRNRVNHSTYIRRIISISRSGNEIERIIVHMQFFIWPSNGFPSSPGSLLAFATDVMSEQALRHGSLAPIIVHCLLGGSLSGLFLIAAAAVCHVRAGHGIIDVPLVFSNLIKFRKGLVDKDSLQFAYRMVLYHAQDTLMKRGILSSTRSTFECFEYKKKNVRSIESKTQHCHPSDDFLQNSSLQIERGISTQQGQSMSPAGPKASRCISSTLNEKSDVIVDPLSQLDPLWSIRR